jgi:hypothetical protein
LNAAGRLRELVALPAREAWPRIARLWALGFGALVVWSRLGVLLHEAAGHALVWRAGGGRIARIHVSLFGGGNVRTDPEVASSCPQFLYHMAGIFVNLLLGLALAGALVYLLVQDARSRDTPGPLSHRRTQRRVVAEHLFAWGAVLNFAGAAHYTALGAFYEFGDPAPYPWAWSPAFMLLVLGMPAAFALWARTLRPLVARDRAARLGLAGLIVAAVPLGGYTVGLALENRYRDTAFVALKAERVALERAVAAERARRLEEWRAEHGDEEPPSEVTEVTEEDVERPFPLTALVLALDVLFLGAVLSVRRRAPGDMRVDQCLRPLSIPWLWPLAAAALTLLVVHLVF